MIYLAVFITKDYLVSVTHSENPDNWYILQMLMIYLFLASVEASTEANKGTALSVFHIYLIFIFYYTINCKSYFLLAWVYQFSLHWHASRQTKTILSSNPALNEFSGLVTLTVWWSKLTRQLELSSEQSPNHWIKKTEFWYSLPCIAVRGWLLRFSSQRSWVK